jgi:cbb3-type cytochrome c oxidase subunit I
MSAIGSTAPFRNPGGPALAFLAAGMVWFVVGALYGLLSAIHYVSPETFSNIAFLVFGRSRPAHVNTVIFGFVVNLLIGAGLYYVPALLKTRIWSVRMAWAGFVLWNLGVLSGPLSFAFGMTQGREYTEYIWPGDMAILLAMLLLVVNIIMTIVRRRESFLYVAIWYFVGTFLWSAATYPIGNVMWRPQTGALAGMLDSIILWFYAHNLVGLLITPLATGAAYYVIPRVTRTPLYSHTLSLIGFWTLVAFYTHIGGHHIIQTPIPRWMQNIAVVHSVVMVVPVFAVLANLFLTIRGFGSRVLADPAGRLVLAGLVWYLITCIQGPAQATHTLQRVTHLNNWTIGHSHIAVLGFGGFIALGGMWHILPLLVRRRIFSERLINLQFGLLMTGLLGFFAVLTIAGLIEGQAWYNGEVVQRTVAETTPYMVLRAAFGISILSASLVGLCNFLMTLYAGEEYSPEYIVNPEVGIL